MLDITAESPISLTAVAAMTPGSRDGRSVRWETVLRWATRGLRGPDGELVRLEVAKLGGKLVTTREAVQRFSERLTPQFAATSPPPTPSARRRAIDAAERELEAAGI